MAKKTKYEKKDTAATAAKFSRDEVSLFVAGSHAKFLRERYLAKIADREPNPRLDAIGQEVLNPHSMVADVDMTPLSTRQNLARFQAMPHDLINGDGYDTDSSLDRDHDFDNLDMFENPPTPHEIRARDLDRRLTSIRQLHADDVKKRREAGAKTGSTEPEKKPDPKGPEEPKGSQNTSIPRE